MLFQVISIFSFGEKLCLVVLGLIAVYTYISFQLLVLTFYLTVSLGVESCTESAFDIKVICNITPILARKNRPTVYYERFRSTVLQYYGIVQHFR